MFLLPLARARNLIKMPLKPDSPGERSCFRGLREALADHFSGDRIREGYAAEEALIRELLRTQPDAPVTQDLLAGFLNGYMLAVAEFGSEDLLSQRNDAMFSVIGGIYLVGGGAPLSCPPEHLDSLRAGFSADSGARYWMTFFRSRTTPGCDPAHLRHDT
jgi:hypothetical protein